MSININIIGHFLVLTLHIVKFLLIHIIVHDIIEEFIVCSFYFIFGEVSFFLLDQVRTDDREKEKFFYYHATL